MSHAMALKAGIGAYGLWSVSPGASRAGGNTPPATEPGRRPRGIEAKRQEALSTLDGDSVNTTGEVSGEKPETAEGRAKPSPLPYRPWIATLAVLRKISLIRSRKPIRMYN